MTKTGLLIVADNAGRHRHLANAFLVDPDLTIINPDKKGELVQPQPDLIVVDLAHPQAPSPEFWVLLHTCFPTAQFMVVVEPRAEKVPLQAALQAGMKSFVEWTDSAARLCEVAKITCDGGVPISPQCVGDAIRELFRNPDNKASGDILQIDSLTVELDARQAKVGDHVLLLSPLEFDLLFYLARHESKVISPAELVREVWKQEPGTSDIANLVNCRIKRLRRKLYADSNNRYEIQTVRGRGYRLIIVQNAPGKN